MTLRQILRDCPADLLFRRASAHLDANGGALLRTRAELDEALAQLDAER